LVDYLLFYVLLGIPLPMKDNKEWGRIRRAKSLALRHRIFKFSKSNKICSVVKNV
jgi:hypothetical protein